jgi:DNA-binding NarL/FixJ family response regulator
MAIDDYAQLPARSRSRLNTLNTSRRRGATNLITAMKSGDQDAGRAISVLLINEPALIRDCLSEMFRKGTRSLEIHCVALGGAVPADGEKPDIAVLNVNAVSVFDVDVESELRRLRANLGAAPILVISERNELSEALRAIDIGAAGYFLSTLGVSLLVAAIRLLLAGGIFLPPALLEQCVAHLPRTGSPAPGSPPGAEAAYGEPDSTGPV